MELKTLRNWIYDVLRVRAERYFPMHRAATSPVQTKH
ncbi:hypothetical protein P3T23_004626 [Paraburkholderia sp. GAS448]